MGGLIYVVIMAVWAVVLVPAWLRRHDHDDPTREVDRFTRSMRQLASRQPVSSDRPHRSPATMPAAAPADVHVVKRSPRASARRGRSAAARRRATLAVLGAALLGTAALVLAGMLPALVLGAPILAITGFVVLARTQVRTSAGGRGSARIASPRVEGSSAPVARRAPGIHADGTWDATQSPLPSYVTAPPASAVPRRIDTATPGAWTGSAMVERAQREKARAESLERAKQEAIAKARAEQAAAEARNRDEEFLAAQAVVQPLRPRRRVVNE